MSSLLFLGFSIILFVISYGIGFTLVAMILGTFFDASSQFDIADPTWAQVYVDTNGVTAYLVPLVPTIGIFVFVIKVLMVASVRGRD